MDTPYRMIILLYSVSVSFKTKRDPASTRENTLIQSLILFIEGSEVADRVDRLAVDADLVVDVRARREARAAHVSDDLAAAHVLAGADDDLHRMAVTRRDAVAVVDVDHVAVAA